MQRLPVYLLLDCSESMAGPAIDAVNTGVAALVADIKSDPHTLETVHLSVITFSSYAKQLTPLTEASRFVAPRLSVRPGTALGAALTLLMDRLTHEVRRTSPDDKGDYRPLVFLLSDGQPTDDWQLAADRLKAMTSPRIANIYAIGCGDDVDSAVFRRITDICLVMRDLTPERIRRLFVWLSSSTKSASRSAGRGDDGPTLDITNLPPDLLQIAPTSTTHSTEPRQFFLHALCKQTRRPYLMRFARQERTGPYYAVASHPLETHEEGDGGSLPPINSSMLMGCPPCPYCRRAAAVVCECGTVFCQDQHDQDAALQCPGCHNQLTPGNGAPFDIRHTEG